MVRSKRAAFRFLNELPVASPPSLHVEGSRALSAAITMHDTATIYRQLMDGFSFQGITDANAMSFIANHGNAEWEVVSRLLVSENVCAKLLDFDSYSGCVFRKSARSCSNPAALEGCPVPTLDLRKGGLNEQAFSLFFFIRDVCHSDVVGFIDESLCTMGSADDVDLGRERLLAALTAIVGVSRKLASMMLSSLLLTAGPERTSWVSVGRSLIVVDSLVHNFLHRTGILHAFNADHRYGPNCYSSAGCEFVLRTLSAAKVAEDQELSPRSIQHAIWRFCAAGELAICNGNNIRDTRRRRLVRCPLFRSCERRTLRPTRRKRGARI